MLPLFGKTQVNSTQTHYLYVCCIRASRHNVRSEKFSRHFNFPKNERREVYPSQVTGRGQHQNHTKQYFCLLRELFASATELYSFHYFSFIGRLLAVKYFPESETVLLCFRRVVSSVVFPVGLLKKKFFSRCEFRVLASWVL
jgi:hypothetical protein